MSARARGRGRSDRRPARRHRGGGAHRGRLRHRGPVAPRRVLSQILPSTVQLGCEPGGGTRRAASGVVLARESTTRRAWIITTRHVLESGVVSQLAAADGHVESHRTARVALPQAPDRMIEIPVAGQTTLIPPEAIRRFLEEVGFGALLDE